MRDTETRTVRIDRHGREFFGRANRNAIRRARYLVRDGEAKDIGRALLALEMEGHYLRTHPSQGGE